MCKARAALAHLNSLLAVLGGAAMVVCGVVLPAALPERAAAIPSAPLVLMVPYVAGPLLLVLPHVAIAALHVGPAAARVLLLVYAACCVLAACAAGGAAGWWGYQLGQWLLEDKPELEAVERELLVLAVAVLVVSGAALLLLLLCAALALAARPRTLAGDEHALRRCSSVYYESTAPAYKTPLGNPPAWQ